MSISNNAVYATKRHSLEDQITDHLHGVAPDAITGEIFALIVPDTNLLAAGPVSASMFSLLQGRSYDTVVLIAPSHCGAFTRLNICSADSYQTPFGAVAVNDAVRHELCDEDDDIFVDDLGHFQTEGISVQLPYLQTILGEFDIVPIIMGEESPELCRELGHAVGEVMYNRRMLIIASADVLDATEESLVDFTEAFEAGEESRLMALLNSERVKMRGKGSVLVALLAAQHRHANRAQVIRAELPQNGTPGAVGAVLWRA